MNTQKVNQVIFKNGTKLGNVIPFLPNGIIDKSETGIGATYLEASCSRNSIIVEPTRAIVVSKSKKHECLGIIGGITPEQLKEQIITYLEKRSGKVLKIFVVSDSVKKLISILIELGIDVFNEFFYLIDEIEQYQTEASYRGKMSLAIDYYNLFKPEKRALVSATIYEFSNPLLKNESMTKYSYEKPSIRNVDLRSTNNPTLEAIAVLEKLEGQTLIFFNSIDGIIKLIELGNLPKEECAVYCGDNSIDKVKEFYQPFTERPKHKYNFYTSAFFSGVDIYGKYNVLTVVDITKMHTLLYPCKLKQIIGRTRDGVITDTIISNFTPHLYRSYANYIESRLDEAFKAIHLIEHNKNYPDNKWFMNIREAILKQEFDGILLVREDKNGEIVPNYEEIDYKFINLWTGTDIYSTQQGLKNHLLKCGARVNFRIINRMFSAEQLGQLNAFREKYEEERLEAVKTVYNFIKDRENEGGFNLNTIDFMQIMYESTGITKKLWKFYSDFRDVEALLESKGEEKYFSDYKIKYSFKKLSENNVFKSKIKSAFPFEVKFTTEEIAKRMNEVFSQTLPGSTRLDSRGAVKQLKKFFKIKRCKLREDKTDRIDGYQIIGLVA
jgi:hypothetical protein